MLRTYKYRLYPTKAQDKALNWLLGHGRNLYNAALEQRIAAYKERGETVRYPDQWAYFRDLRHQQPDTLGKLNATSVQQMLRRLDKTFAAFFRRVRAGETPGFPRFKGAHRFRSLEYRHGDGCKLRAGERTTLHIQNVGEVKVKYHRPLPDGAEIKHVIIKRSLHKWYVCLMLDVPHATHPVHTGEAVGIDTGLLRLLTLSDGNTIANPRWLRHALAKLRVAQRRLSRRWMGSHRRRKAAYQVARLHQQIADQRDDFWHKETRKLATTYSLIAIEDLTLDFMMRNHHLALSASDAGLGVFRQLLSYKVEETGSRLVVVTPQHTSQVCSRCGARVPKDLRVRTHDCPQCGLSLDRDLNAARNILHFALDPPGLGGQDSTWPVGACVS